MGGVAGAALGQLEVGAKGTGAEHHDHTCGGGRRLAGQWEGMRRQPAARARGCRGAGSQCTVSPAGGLGSSARGSERSPAGVPSPQPGPPSPGLALTPQSTPRSFWKQTLPGFEEEGATTRSQAHFPSGTEGPAAHEEPPSHCVLILALACHHLHLRFRGEAGSGSYLPREGPGFRASSRPGRRFPPCKAGPGGAYS